MMVMITHTKIIPSIPQLLRWYWNRWSKRIWKFSQEAVLLRDSEGPHPNPALIEERACWHPSWLKKVANLFESLHDLRGVRVCSLYADQINSLWFNVDSTVIKWWFNHWFRRFDSGHSIMNPQWMTFDDWWYIIQASLVQTCCFHIDCSRYSLSKTTY